jgi:DNA topoisomerase-3
MVARTFGSRGHSCAGPSATCPGLTGQSPTDTRMRSVVDGALLLHAHTMPYRLILAEKPSVARDIARVLGIHGRHQGWLGDQQLRVSWCLGHLAELAEPASYDPAWRRWSFDNLPMLPERFGLQPRKDSGADQWRVVRDLLRDRDCAEVVNACDAGREGELIFAHCYELAGCEAPVQRLWISSMTDKAIRAGFAKLRDGGTMRNLEAAARCRTEADWLVGLNATRAMTIRLATGPGGALRSLGRVQTPTLAMLCDREQAIDDFVPRDFWEVRATFARGGPDGERWEATWTAQGPDGKADGEGSSLGAGGADGSSAGAPGRLESAQRHFSKGQAQAIADRVAGGLGLVGKVDRKRKREKPPQLYDLTSLQREANQRFGFTAERSLEIAQALYERHKVLTYPRTDSRHIGTDQLPELPDIAASLRFGPYAAAAELAGARDPASLGKRFVDDGEVSDHHAIIPTGTDPRRQGLSRDEKLIFDLVTRRFLGAFHPDAVFATVSIDTVVGDDHFLAKGRSRLEAGWQAIDPPQSKKKELLLPPVERGEQAPVVEVGLHDGQTRPPRRFNDASLLGAMERAGEELEDAELKRAMKRNGLGTPATRAAIIETLIKRGYVERQERHIVPTPVGRALIRALPVEALRSPRLTGEWEARLVAMAEGQDDRDAFMADTRAFAADLVATLRDTAIPRALVDILATRPSDGALLGGCPRCGGEVREGRGGWSCSGCPLFLPAKVARREISPRMAKTLLEHGTTKVVKGFKSRENKPFEAALRIDEQGKVRLHFPDPDPLGSCPACGKPVRRRGKIYTCDTGRECRFVVFGEMTGKSIPEAAVKQLLAKGRSALITGFVSRDGRKFDGVLVWTDQRVEVRERDPREDDGSAGPCPLCQAPVAFSRRKWRCTSCGFRLPGSVAQRDLALGEVRDLLGKGRTPRLHGFRQKGGSVFKAALTLNEQQHIALDYSRDHADEIRRLPPGSPPPAFGRITTCPCCVQRAETEPGYVVAGRAAWGCSRWKQGCALRVPFVIEGKRLEGEDAQRLFGKHKATRYSKGLGDRQRTARVALVPEADPCWRVEERGAKRKDKA